jgi:predicted phosphodiesterase
MRLVVLSDIHGNRPALEAVVEAVDRLAPTHVVVAGDIINRGPHPRCCLERVLARRASHHWQVLRGNHEDFVILEATSPRRATPWEHQLYAHTRWTLDHVRDLVPDLQALPDRIVLQAPDGSELRFLHASMRSNRHGLYAHMSEDDVGELIAPAPPVMLVGHTHIPFVRTVGQSLVVNAGAVGLPFDGDTRASFALLEWNHGRWRAEIIRLPYDLAQARRDFLTSGYLAEGGPMVRLILDELEKAQPRLGWWHRHFEARVARGELSLEDSVELLQQNATAGIWT